MPAKSEKQRRALYAKFGSDWVHKHHFDVVEGKQKRKPRKPKKGY